MMKISARVMIWLFVASCWAWFGGPRIVSAQTIIVQKAEEGTEMHRTPSLVVDVTELGAKGDGATDDQPVIQKAVEKAEAAGGGTVVIPPSETPYIVRDSITITGSNVRIVGYGATLKLADHAKDGVITDVIQVVGTAEKPVEDLVIAGLTLDGNYWAQSGSKNPRCLDCDYAVRALVKDCHFTRGFVAMTFGEGCRQCTALDCLVTLWHNDGFNADGGGSSGGSSSISFINCHARGAPNERDGGLPGSRDSGWEIEDGVQDVWLVNCSVEHAGGDGFTVRNHGGYEHEVTENINFVNCRVTDVAKSAWDIYSRTATNVTRGIRLLNCYAACPVKLFSGVEQVIVSGDFPGGLLLGRPDKPTPLRDVEICNVRTSYLVLLAQEVFVANVVVQADGARGVELLEGCSDVEMAFCTVTGAGETGIACANVAAVIANCVVWGNGTSLAVEGEQRPTMSHCCVEGGLPDGCSDGGGNVNEGPGFRDAENGDLRLGEGSPCLGAGLPLAGLSHRLRLMAARDLAGRPRPDPPESLPDLGPWESAR